METTQPANVLAEYTKAITHFKLPGIDLAAILESRRKDIEALGLASSAALSGVQAIAQKQVAILQSAISGLQSLITKPAAQDAAPAANTGEVVQQAVKKSLADIQDLVDTAYRAQSDSVAVVTKRVAEHVEELKALVQSKK
ncbi:phasin family protein [Paraburkholderia mimosarum]|uniref:phasin family protein n=1 Tax=Paraburkholderia mimosarum TaxID=312026 RepID=UPI0003F691B0|nr:phasin family protein [Paraburkholderia mimosarum]